MAAPFLASMAASSDRRLAVSSEIQEDNKVKHEGTHTYQVHLLTHHYLHKT